MDFKRKIIYILLCGSFVACGFNNNDKQDVHSAGKKGSRSDSEKKPTAENTYTSELRTVKTGDKISESVFKITKQTQKKSVQVDFKFNSQQSSRFKLVRVRTKTSCLALPTDISYSLLDKEGRGEAIGLFESKVLQTKSDYVLRVEIGESECSSIELFVTAWADDVTSDVSPQVSLRCNSKDFSAVDLFVQEFPIKAFTQTGDERVLLSEDVFCKNKYDLSAATSKIADNGEGKSYYYSVQTKTGEQVEYILRAKAQGAMQVICKKNKEQFADYSFTECEEHVVNPQLYH